MSPRIALRTGKFCFDEIYQARSSGRCSLLATLSYVLDRLVIDGLVDLCGRLPRCSGSRLRSLQIGLVQFYALAMVLGLLVLLGMLLIAGRRVSTKSETVMDILLPARRSSLPLAGVGVIWASAEGGYQPARLIALATAVGTFMAGGSADRLLPGLGGEHFVTGVLAGSSIAPPAATSASAWASTA